MYTLICKKKEKKEKGEHSFDGTRKNRLKCLIFSSSQTLIGRFKAGK